MKHTVEPIRNLAGPPQPRALTPPVSLTDLFDIEQLQAIQDAFAKATRVASIITSPEGTPVTRPSNFCRLCRDIIRKTEKGLANCVCSDSFIGRQNPDGPIISTCLSGGLWDAGASITVAGAHVGNWLIGQIRNEISDQKMDARYASEIEADENEFRRALDEVPLMPIEQFRDIAQLVFFIANELSLKAYQNLVQSQYIAEKKKTEIALRDSSYRLKLLLELSNAIVSKLEVTQLFRLVPAQIRKAIQCDAVCLSMPDAYGKRFTICGLDFPESNGILREAAEGRDGGSATAFLTGRPHTYGRMPRGLNGDDQQINEGEGFQSGCFIPVIAGQRKLAVLRMSDRRPDFFSPSDVDFLTQVANQVAIALDNALQYQQLRRSREKLAEQNLHLARELQANCQFEEIVGDSFAFRGMLRHVATVAGTDSTVLILGETGTGKELIARAIHNSSARRDRIFVKLNCSAIPTGLFESELFGHERGAFTGAVERKIGRFEVANGGTLFLDEIGDVPLDLQPKLLRVLQEREFERLGGTRPIRVDVRVVAATNRDLEQMMLNNQFRPDLFYRLNVFPVVIAPLREHRDDIPALVRHFTSKFARRMNRTITEIPDDVMQALLQYDWPGNVRELENLIERAVILSTGPALLCPFSELSKPRRARQDQSPSTQDIKDIKLLDVEREHIRQTLQQCGWVLGGANGAASRLGIPRTTLLYKIRRLGLSRNDS